MTVRINKNALNLREELTKAQGVVRYEQRQFWMDGLVENGTFDNDLSGWSSAGLDVASVSVVGSAARLVGNSYIYQTISGLTAGKPYFLTVDITETNSQGSLRIGTSINGGDIYDSPTQTSAKTLTRTFTPSGTTVVITLKAEGTTGNTAAYMDFDNVAVFEVDENDEVIHSLPLGWKPLHVYEDGLIQREGDVHDYTVVKTGGAYAIKPAVQPTGATETCVIAEREL